MPRHRHAEAIDEVRSFALGLPDAWEDHPWDDYTVKVAKKIFVFGPAEQDDGSTAISVKLPESGPAVLQQPYASPTRYGLGKSGWVTALLPGDEDLPVDLLCDWVDESYRAVAGVRRVARLDARLDGEG